jgi:hypothetical protein
VSRPRLLTALTALAVAIAVVVAGRGWAIGTCAAAMIPDAVATCPCCPTDDAPASEPRLTARCCDLAPAAVADPHPPLATSAAPALAEPPRALVALAPSAPPPRRRSVVAADAPRPRATEVACAARPALVR